MNLKHTKLSAEYTLIVEIGVTRHPSGDQVAQYQRPCVLNDNYSNVLVRIAVMGDKNSHITTTAIDRVHTLQNKKTLNLV